MRPRMPSCTRGIDAIWLSITAAAGSKDATQDRLDDGLVDRERLPDDDGEVVAHLREDVEHGQAEADRR